MQTLRGQVSRRYDKSDALMRISLRCLFAVSLSTSLWAWTPQGVSSPRGYLISETSDAPNDRISNLFHAMRFGTGPLGSFGNAPFIGYGHSAGNGNSMKAHEARPEKSLALAIVHLSAGGSSDEPQIFTPTMLMTSWRDFPHEMLEPAMSRRVLGARYFMAMKPSGVHDWSDSEVMMHPFFQQVFLEAYPFENEGGSAVPRRIPEEEGWLVFADETFPNPFANIAPANGYSGNLYNSMWTVNEYTACTWRAFISGGADFSMTSPAMDENRFARSVSHGSNVDVSASKPKGSYRTATLWDGNIPLKEFAQGEEIRTTLNDLAVGCHSFHCTAQFENDSMVTTRNTIMIVRGADADVFLRDKFQLRRSVKGTATKIKAWAKTYDGSSVSKVEFFAGTQSLGSKSSAPYEMDWTPSSLGQTVVKAVLHTSKGTQVHSFPVLVRVTETPVPTTIQMRPAYARLRPGRSQKFTAVVRDQYGYEVAPQPQLTFTSEDGGTMSGSEFTAGAKTQSTKVLVKSGALTGTAAVDISSMICINFGPMGYVPDGYLADFGSKYEQKGELTYGWINGSRHSRARTVDPDVWGVKASFIPLRVQLSPPWNKGWGTYDWEIALPNGEYTVKIIAGDAAPKYDVGQWTNITTQHYHRIKAEDVLVVNDTGYLDNPVVEGTKDVTLTDGKLTISNVWRDADDAGLADDDKEIRVNMGKLCAVEIAPKGEFSSTKTSFLPRGQLGSVRVSAIGGRIKVLASGSAAAVRIIAPNGRVLVKKSISPNVASETAAQLAQGTYVVQVEGSGAVSTHKVCVLR